MRAISITPESIKTFFENRPSLDIKKMERESNLPIQKIIDNKIQITSLNSQQIYSVLKKYGYTKQVIFDTENTLKKALTFFGFKDDVTSKEIYRNQIESFVSIIESSIKNK